MAEDATFQIFSKSLLPAAPTPLEASFNTTPAKTGAAAPSDGDLSAAATPEKEEASSPVFSSSSSLPPATLSFDPSFGAAASSGSDAASDALLAELISQGVIPSGMGSEVVIQSLYLLCDDVAVSLIFVCSLFLVSGGN